MWVHRLSMIGHLTFHLFSMLGKSFRHTLKEACPQLSSWYVNKHWRFLCLQIYALGQSALCAKSTCYRNVAQLDTMLHLSCYFSCRKLRPACLWYHGHAIDFAPPRPSPWLRNHLVEGGESKRTFGIFKEISRNIGAFSAIYFLIFANAIYFLIFANGEIETLI